MKPILFIALLLLAFECHGWARLGETQDGLIARYGAGSKARAATADNPASVMIFHKQNWAITVQLIDGISVGESFQTAGGPKEDDVAALLADNSQGHTWTLSAPNRTLLQSLIPTLAPTTKEWRRDDGAFAFTPSPLPYCLTIKSKQLVDLDAAKDAAAKKAAESSTKGF